MAVWVGSCPHCRAQHMTFPIIAAEMIAELRGNVYFSCPSCRGPIAARIFRKSISNPISMDKLAAYPRALDEANYEVKEVFPTRVELGAPEAVPSAVGRSFAQAEEARVRGHLEAAGMSYRRALELALKEIGPELKGTLEKRIDKLAEDHRLTPALAEWSHSVRQLGNEAAHDEPEPTVGDTKDLADFSRVVLEYLFTMPAKVRPKAVEG